MNKLITAGITLSYDADRKKLHIDADYPEPIEACFDEGEICQLLGLPPEAPFTREQAISYHERRLEELKKPKVGDVYELDPLKHVRGATRVVLIDGDIAIELGHFIDCGWNHERVRENGTFVGTFKEVYGK